MQLPTLPSWMRHGLPGVVSSDSPFPPLKPDKRYRGVYERAGFDVNLGGMQRSSENGSPAISQQESSSHRFNGKKVSPSGSHHSHSSRSRGRTLSALQLKTPMSAPLNYSSFQASPQYNNEIPPLHSARTFERSVSNPYTTQTQHRQNEDYGYTQQEDTRSNRSYGRQPSLGELGSHSGHLSNNASQLNYASGNDHSQQLYQPFQPFQPAQNEKSLHSILNENTSAHQEVPSEKNKKHLRLDLQDSNFSVHSALQVNDSSSLTHDNYPYTNDSSAGGHLETESRNTRGHRPTLSDASAASVQTCQLMESTAPYPAKDYGQLYTPSSEKHLSSDLADLRQDVEHHKRAESRSSASEPTSYPHHNQAMYPDHMAENPYNSHSYTHGNPSAHFNMSVDEAGSSHEDLSFKSNVRHSDETVNTTVEDIPNMLNVYPEKNNRTDARLSTISSILSRRDQDSRGEDEEIERELERQLEDLKTGSNTSLDFGGRINDSFITASEVPVNPGFFAPAIYINDTPSVHSTGELLDESLDKRSFHEAVTPLFSRADNPKFDDLKEPLTPNLDRTYTEDCDTPETIKPLSPKAHHIALELQNLRISSQVVEDSKLEEPQQLISEDEILAANTTPAEFDAFPRSVFDPSVPSFRTKSMARTSPGTGPCRSCHTEVEKGAKGSQKAIFSRSGELSGQWHRGCFHCLYDNCGIVFNKQITPYVLLDNPFCHHHYHSLNDTLCGSCNRGIEGECIENELKQKWHPDCLKCAKCLSNISEDYYCVNNDIFCEADAIAIIEQRNKLGLLTSDRVEKRRTRLMYLDQGPSF